MNKFKRLINPIKWSSALLLAVITAGCGNGDPILGGGGAGTSGSLTDVIKPRVTVTVPATTDPGPTPGPAANAAITATFTESIDSATLDDTSFTVANTTGGGTAVPGTVTYVDSSKIVRFKPTAGFTNGITYTATIAGTGTAPVTDVAGNALAGNTAALPAASDYVWTFTPGPDDNTAPTITLTNPAAGDTGVVLNTSVNATFDEAMDPATICGPASTSATCPVASFTLDQTSPSGPAVTGVVNYDTVNDIATFNPSSNLASNTQYTATVTTAATDLADNPLGAGAVQNPWNFTTGDGLAPGAIALGSASTFGIMATAAITSANASVINGDASLEPGTSMTGFPPAVVNGETHINDTVSHQARADLLAAYNEAKGRACATTVGTADLGGLYVYPNGIPPGVYCSGSTMLVGTQIVLDGGGNANAVWVFQIGSSLTANADVTLTGGAQAKNVFWVPTQDATIGSSVTFNGTIVTGRDATAEGSDTINGRILAGAIDPGTIALDGPPNTVNVPAP